ncbi:hypothetical protein P700755_003123 [Psychroflexus torquis ATCC 700755]|uniref:Uncharacterized protein n=1 Tax=Psychroflexus torquis (strain ATCC 700755 / CIP 106069 / ACAM 623) TaxID=313595 RepID=K4IGY4_PSYTT|nr:hypothetical protein P700755_003123 [Psychroflexus torquis ATCC 700755]
MKLLEKISFSQIINIVNQLDKDKEKGLIKIINSMLIKKKDILDEKVFYFKALSLKFN